jgi:hypothetical protein
LASATIRSSAALVGLPGAYMITIVSPSDAATSHVFSAAGESSQG